MSGMGVRARESLSPENFEYLSNMHLIGVGEGRDVACSVAFLLADTGRWITGSTLFVDGGYTAR
jgi:NAD(P)-dependent dehydrogenase (short-subunit alcohol dehydrogenase family)